MAQDAKVMIKIVCVDNRLRLIAKLTYLKVSAYAREGWYAGVD